MFALLLLITVDGQPGAEAKTAKPPLPADSLKNRLWPQLNRLHAWTISFSKQVVVDDNTGKELPYYVGEGSAYLSEHTTERERKALTDRLMRSERVWLEYWLRNRMYAPTGRMWTKELQWRKLMDGRWQLDYKFWVAPD